MVASHLPVRKYNAAKATLPWPMTIDRILPINEIVVISMHRPDMTEKVVLPVKVVTFAWNPANTACMRSIKTALVYISTADMTKYLRVAPFNDTFPSPLWPVLLSLLVSFPIRKSGENGTTTSESTLVNGAHVIRVLDCSTPFAWSSGIVASCGRIRRSRPCCCSRFGRKLNGRGTLAHIRSGVDRSKVVSREVR